LGFTFYTKHEAKVATTASQGASVATVPDAPQINTANDLTTAERALDSTAGANSNDSSQLDGELATF
jgi:hypothetical protein